MNWWSRLVAWARSIISSSPGSDPFSPLSDSGAQPPGEDPLPQDSTVLHSTPPDTAGDHGESAVEAESTATTTPEVITDVPTQETPQKPPYVSPLRSETEGAQLPMDTEMSDRGRRHGNRGWAVDIRVSNWRYRAIGHGVVVYVTDLDDIHGNGIGVWIELSDGPLKGWRVAGIHLTRKDVSTGDTVEPGDILGITGSTGHSTGPHLHLELQPPQGTNERDPMDPTLIDWKGAGWAWGGWD